MYIDFDKIKGDISGYSSYDDEVIASTDELFQKAIYAEGVSDGEEKTKKKTASEMLKRNIDENIISECTKLNISEINNIKKEINLI